MSCRSRQNSVDEADSESDDEIYTVDTRQSLQDIAHKMRAQAIKVTTQQKEGFPTSCSSVAEIISALFFNPMRFNKKKPKDPGNDRIILSNSNALPMIYAAWAEAEYIRADDIRSTIRSDIEGPAPQLKVVDVNLKSLEQGVAVAVGMAYVRQFIDQTYYWVYCIVVDASKTVGSVSTWDALKFAGHYKLRRLLVIFDVNGDDAQQTAQSITNLLDSYGFSTATIDGHNIEALTTAYYQASLDDEKFSRPSALICKTVKGKYLPGYENKNEYHGKVFDKAESQALIQHVTSLHRPYGDGEHDIYDLISDKESPDGPLDLPKHGALPYPEYSRRELISTSRALEHGFLKLANKLGRVVYLAGCDTNTKGSMLSITSLKDRYIAEKTGECIISIGIGMACRNRTTPFISASADLFVRNFDQVIMGVDSKINLNCVGSYAGVIIGEAEGSSVILNDLALFGSVPTSTVFYPSDAVSCDHAVGLAATTKGISYIRTCNFGTPVLYDNKTKFKLGLAHILRESPKDQILLVGVGITTHEALKAAKELEKLKIYARVMDMFTIKPIDRHNLLSHAISCNRRVVTVEDHQFKGGIAEAAQEVFGSVNGVVVKSLYMSNIEDNDVKIPPNGTPEELLTLFGIDSSAIVEAAKDLVGLVKMEPVAIVKTEPVAFVKREPGITNIRT